MYYFPNRPILVPPDPLNPMQPQPDYLNSLEAGGKYAAEQKFNGDNCLIYTGKKIEFWNRHKAQLKYVPSAEVLDIISKWPAGCVINAELMHNKTKTIKDTLIVHSALVWKGKPMIGKTWSDARLLIESLVYSQTETGPQLSKLYPKGFWELFQKADGATIEGIILKDPKGKLVISTTPLKDVSWMLKIRKPCKKYSF